MAASIHDVARRAGVSIATVSRILNHSATVSEKKVAAVQEAMEFYHYEPNQFGRGLVKQTSHIMGVYFPRSAGSVFESSYNLELLKGVEQVLSKNEYSMVLISESEDYETRKEAKPRFVEYIGQKRIDGLLLSGITRKSAEEKVFKQMILEQYPLVYIGKRLHEKGYNVYAQFEKYVYQMVHTLYQNGHRKILLYYAKATHEDGIGNVKEKAECELEGIQLYLAGCGGYSAADRTEVRQTITKYVGECGYTAICSPGMEATRFLFGIFAELKISVPEDVSIITVEHKLGEGELVYPAVSAFYVPAKDMGIGAANMLLSAVREEEIADKSKEYETVYIERESIRHL